MIRIALIAAFVSVWTSAAAAYTYPCTTPAPVCVITSAPTSGTTTQVANLYYTYVWNYTASGSNTLVLEDCTTFTTAPTIVFKDLNGGAGMNPITAFTTGSNTIDGIPYPNSGLSPIPL